MKYERNEYPRPQFQRENWQNLNGEWEFEWNDSQNSNHDDKKPILFTKKINVPFSYQWEASGINDKDVHEILWYRRRFKIKEENQHKNALLCFNAADYQTDVWINNHHVLTHQGGFSPFHIDITQYLNEEVNEIIVRCIDTLETTVPRGKQTWTGKPFGCFYYPNSGLWGSVWIDFFEEDCIENYHFQPNIDTQSMDGKIKTYYGFANELELILKFKNKVIKTQSFPLNEKYSTFTIQLSDTSVLFSEMLWDVENPNLIDIDLKLLKNKKIMDEAHTRIGLRKIHINEQGKICLNYRPLYQKLVLDQGYWNESGLTPLSANAIKKDILLAKEMGFNGARKHQKFEDPYFYYYADELGFLTWCEMPSAFTFCEKEMAAITKEWQEIVNVAKNFTSVIFYVPLNESWGTNEIKTNKTQQNFAKSLYYLTKSLDNNRLVSTNDGFENIEESDILSIHDYEIKNEEEFPTKYNGNYDGMKPQGFALFADGHKYKGQPILFTEFGGIAFENDKKGDAWGYGNAAKDADDFCARLESLINGIAKTDFQGYCYTQLTDVQQEINGLLYANRTPKVELERLKKIFTK